MSQTTGIQWCDSTLNLQMGCDGCELWNPSAGVARCYAGVITERMNLADALRGWPKSFDRPEIFAHRIKEAERWSDLAGKRRTDKPWLNGYPRLIFLNDMGDTFTESLPIDWLAPFLPRLAATPHLYLLLTKRPRRAAEFFLRHACPGNFWIGTSITGPQYQRLDDLARVPCARRFISYEPAWEPLDWTRLPSSIEWIILGGESGPAASYFDTVRVEEVLRLNQRRHGLAVFVKQLGSHPFISNANLQDWPDHVRVYAEGEGFAAGRVKLIDGHGGDWDEWPEAWRVRELPKH